MNQLTSSLIFLTSKFYLLLLFSGLFICPRINAQPFVDSILFGQDVRLSFDWPVHFYKKKPTILILYALPNGNTTEQTKGKKLNAGDDWHYDIQHISAQTKFIRQQLSKKNIVVVYLENNFKSWPLWKQKHPDHLSLICHIFDTINHSVRSGKKVIYLNGHSGGGSFIFGYMAAVQEIPVIIRRISFLDSDYAYDSTYFQKIRNWLAKDKGNRLTVFAYNDSVALYNGKPVVSATGGTWWRSHKMKSDLEAFYTFSKTRDDSLVYYESKKKQVGFFFKTNPTRGIYHTQQVELNGFIHSVLYGTRKESVGYEYFGPRTYQQYIK